MKELEIHGFYTVRDEYFTNFPGHWDDNKQEKRPFYYLFKDSDGMLWVIPITSQVGNYRRKIEKEEAKYGKGNCIYYYIGKFSSLERVFLIGNMMPITVEYIKSPFTIKSIHYVSRNSKQNAEIHKKAMRYLRMVEQGKIKSRNNILEIKRTLLSNAEKE